MDSRRQQQFPPLLQTQAGGHPQRQHLPLPPPHMAMGPRPSFSGGPSPPLSGHKRNNMALYNRPSDGPSFTKLFVGSLPRNISEEEVRDLFSDFGNVVEVSFLKDKKTGLSQGCCFIKYSAFADAEKAVRALDNQRTLKGASEPLQVKFADGDRDHSGPFEYKLFVGSVSRQANEQDIEEIFAPYGRVDNVYVIRNEHKQSRGCAFVSYPEKEMAFAAISGLDGVYRMAGCHQPLIVRFADPKRPRSGEGRMGNMGFNYSPHSYQSGPRGGGAQGMRAQNPGFGWRQGEGPGNVGILPQSGILPLGAQDPVHSRGAPLQGRGPTLDGRAGVGSLQASPIMPGQMGFSGTSPQLSQQQGPYDSPLHKPAQSYGNQLSLHQQATQPNAPQLNQLQPVQGIPVVHPSDRKSQQLGPGGQFPTPQVYGMPPVSHAQSQQHFVAPTQQSMLGVPNQQIPLQSLQQQNPQQSHQPSMMSSQHGQQQMLPLQPLTSQLQHPVPAKEQPQLQQQTAVKDTVQQPYMQPSQSTSQQPIAAGTLQPSWAVPMQQQVVTPSVPPTVAVLATPAPVLITCDWTEHTSPEGHKYYYNSTTRESRWEKPEEYAAYERQKVNQQQQQQLQQEQQQRHPQPQQQQVQIQPHVQQLQPQLLNQQYQFAASQQSQPLQLANQQSQPSLLQQPYSQMVQPYQQQQQAQLQQIQPHHLQLQQPQLQQLQQQQVQQQQQLTPAQQQPGMHQQSQPQASSVSSAVPFSQSSSGTSYQPVQAYAHMQPAAHQELQLNQQVTGQALSANGTNDATRGNTQWMPAVQQALPNQEWMWNK